MHGKLVHKEDENSVNGPNVVILSVIEMDRLVVTIAPFLSVQLISDLSID